MILKIFEEMEMSTFPLALLNLFEFSIKSKDRAFYIKTYNI